MLLALVPRGGAGAVVGMEEAIQMLPWVCFRRRDALFGTADGSAKKVGSSCLAC